MTDTQQRRQAVQKWEEDQERSLSLKQREESMPRRMTNVSNTERAGQIRAQKGPLDLASRRSLEGQRGTLSVEEKYKHLMRVATRMSGMRVTGSGKYGHVFEEPLEPSECLFFLKLL